MESNTETSKMLKVQVEDLNEWLSFVHILCNERHLRSVTDDDCPLGRRWIFRGQSNADWPLASSFERAVFSQCFGADRNRLERELMDDFSREISGYGYTGLCRLETLALMQHHGMPTRLLDFSESPLVALYFALSAKIERWDKFSVWAVCIDGLRSSEVVDDTACFPGIKTRRDVLRRNLDLAEKILNEDSPEDLLEPASVFYVFPQNGNKRFNAQAGVFLLQRRLDDTFMDDLVFSVGEKFGGSFPAEFVELQTLKKSEKFVNVVREANLLEFVFDGKIYESCKVLLEMANVSAHTLFPDVTGAALSIKERMANHPLLCPLWNESDDVE